MNYIRGVLYSEDSSIEDLMNCFEEVKRNGDVAVIKFDGERRENTYTVFISFPEFKGRDMIRADETDIRKAMTKVLKAYVGV